MAGEHARDGGSGRLEAEHGKAGGGGQTQPESRAVPSMSSSPLCINLSHLLSLAHKHCGRPTAWYVRRPLLPPSHPARSDTQTVAQRGAWRAFSIIWQCTPLPLTARLPQCRRPSRPTDSPLQKRQTNTRRSTSSRAPHRSPRGRWERSLGRPGKEHRKLSLVQGGGSIGRRYAKCVSPVSGRNCSLHAGEGATRGSLPCVDAHGCMASGQSETR